MVTIGLEKILSREINNRNRIFLHKGENCQSAYDNSARHLCSLYPQLNAFDRIYHTYEIVLKRVMLSSAVIEKFVERTLVQTDRADEMEISTPEEKKAEFESRRSAFGVQMNFQNWWFLIKSIYLENLRISVRSFTFVQIQVIEGARLPPVTIK